MKTLLWTAFFILISLSISLAEGKPEEEVKSINALKVEKAIKVDGLLDEECWQKAEKSGGFIQGDPHDGEPATESTYVQVCYDNAALYVAVTCMENEPEKIIKRLTRRDRFSEGDVVNLGIDSYHDHQTGYMFKTYTSGTQADLSYYNDILSDDKWDGVWESDVKIDKDRWIVEYRIPFSCLRFPKKEEHTWGFYVSRLIPHNSNEICRWVRVPSNQPGFISKFGHLKGIKGIEPPRHLEILPYAVSTEKTEAKRLGNTDGKEFSGNVGVDIKYGITSNLTLDATINPDFGQVEIDQIILNLSNYETFYPEKRPFFLEGSNIFSTPYFEFFYSRRIGKDPGYSDSAEYYFHRPTSTTILGAVKVTGKTKKGTTIGFLNAVTQREKADFWNFAGYRSNQTIEPEANYNAIRLSQDILKNSVIGIMTTAVNQKGVTPSYAGGLDWTIRFLKENYSFIGQIMGSRNGKNSNEKGLAGKAGLYKDGGTHWTGGISGTYLDSTVDFNRLGFLRNNNTKGGDFWVAYKNQKQHWKIKSLSLNSNLGYSWSLNNKIISRYLNINTNFGLTNNWYLYGGYYGNLGWTYDVREVPQELYKTPAGYDWWLGFTTDQRKNISGEVIYEWQQGSGSGKSLNLSVVFKPKSNLDFSLGPFWAHYLGTKRFAGYGQDASDSSWHYIFEEQEYKNAGLSFRTTYTFTKNLTVQLYSQLFFATGEYTNPKRFSPPDQFSPLDDIDNLSLFRGDFNMKEFASNLIMRWEYRPGSTIYLVWTQGRHNYDPGDLNLRKDVTKLFDTISDNVFLIKANYWWNL
jgi:hypothetical protein